MKLFLNILLIILFIPLVFGTECIVGIDNYCDPNCIPVDYDCPQNPYAGIQDSQCISSPDGKCDPNCMDSDWDCLFEQGKQSTSDTGLFDVGVFEELKEEPQSFIASFENNSLSAIQIIMLLAGIILIMAILLIYLHRLRYKKNAASYEALIPYGQASLEQGYTLNQIDQDLKSKGYSEKFIKGYLRALERRP